MSNPNDNDYFGGRAGHIPSGLSTPGSLAWTGAKQREAAMAAVSKDASGDIPVKGLFVTAALIVGSVIAMVAYSKLLTPTEPSGGLSPNDPIYEINVKIVNGDYYHVIDYGDGHPAWEKWGLSDNFMFAKNCQYVAEIKRTGGRVEEEYICDRPQDLYTNQYNRKKLYVSRPSRPPDIVSSSPGIDGSSLTTGP